MREDEKRLREALERCTVDLRALDEDIALALSGGKDDLARFAIRRLIPRRNESAALRAQLEQRGAEIHALSERLTLQQTQFDSLRVRVRAELGREAAVVGSPPWPYEAAAADEEVELELMRRRQAAEGRS
jgi:phage shock protein A